MAGSDSTEAQNLACDPVFATTHWSVIIEARDAESPQAVAALERLCRSYWYPLYAYVRRHGYSPEDAQDLTQGFFARLLARRSLSSAQPELGRFRWFLLCAVKRFLINDRERAAAAKRGGTATQVSFDLCGAEERYHFAAADQETPDKLFDRAWALTVMQAASDHLQEEYRLEGKERVYQVLCPFLGGKQTGKTYAAAGAELGMSEGAVKVAMHRMRRRYRDLVRQEVAQTISTASNLEEELQSLKAAFVS
jgi:RNA polymerase sigma-70 factor (ECF subfamily)